MPLPFPARAIASRLRNQGETQSWAGFLPPELQRLRQPNAVDERLPSAASTAATSSSATGSSLNADAPPFHHSRGSLALQAEAPAFTLATDTVCSERLAGKEVALEKKRQKETPSLSRVNDIWELSKDRAGCRVVQDAFEAGPDKERLRLAVQLKGHVWEALRCPNANYVVQKCITTTRPGDSQFIIDELLQGTHVDAASGPPWVARHRYGCRVVERLLEHCSAAQAKPLIDSILTESIQLCAHPYGNYVMQHILEHGSPEHKHIICRLLEPLAKTLGGGSLQGSEYVCAVFGKALTHGSPEDRARLARSVILVPCLLTDMASTRHGHVTAKLVLQAADCEHLEMARSQLTAKSDFLRQSRYGRFVIASLDLPPPDVGVLSRLSQRAGGA